MRKLVSIILIAVMLMSVLSVSAFAENNNVQNEFLYQDKFEEFIGLPERTDELIENHETYYYDYNELYYHKHPKSGEVDWVLARAFTNVPPPPWMRVLVKQIGNRVIKSISPGIVKLPYSYVVYNAYDDCFYDIENLSPEEYNGLAQAFEELELGYAVGDVDEDGRISIIDVTNIQLYLAMEKEIEDTYKQYFDTLTDFDGDSKITIMDATSIQLRLANIYDEPVVNEEMVFSDYSQRLASMPYNAVAMFFDEEYSEKQLGHSVYKAEKFGNENTIVIIKSNEQYRELFKEDAPIFEDDFFENKCIIASLVRTHGMKGSATVAGVAKSGDTLYVQVLVFTPSGNLEPISPYLLSMVSVDKNLVSDVYNVVEVYGY
ncbi:MAG: dockerin type I repeat-containing protein [Ruminococcus sp.]|nr:dockerin type I repeat-containing protein [Ruminococcus sp.]